MQSVEELREIIAEQQSRIDRLETRLANKRLLLDGLSQLAAADPMVDAHSVVFRSLHQVFRFDEACAFEGQDQETELHCIAAERKGRVGLSLPAEGPLRRAMLGRVLATDVGAGHALDPLGGRFMLLLPTALDDRKGALILVRDDVGFDRAEIELGRRFALLAQQALAVKRFAIREFENRRLRELSQREAEGRNAAEAANRAKSRFLASMSHEIRTPMNGIISMAEMLEDSRLDRDQWLMARTIRTSADALLTVINDILDFSRIEADRVALRNERFDLAGLAFEVARLLVPLAADKGLELCVEASPDLPRAFMGDGQRLRQVLLNLVGNAVKFTDAGVVHVALARRDPPGHGVGIAVRDTGCGIPEDKFEHIFSAFERVDEIEKGHIEGTGLGLAISSGLVRLMGGRLEVQSAVGAGSLFTVAVDLPAAPDAMPDRPEPLLKGCQVVLVEPQPDARRIIFDQLKALGATVEAHADPEALVARTGREDPDFRPQVLIAGCVRPDDRILDLMTRTQAWRDAAGIGVVLMSGSSAGSDAARQLGFADVLMKPVRTGTLGRVVAGVVRQLRPESPAMPQPRPASRRFSLDVLVAEDNRTNQLVMQKMLGRMGLSATFARNGAEAVERACARAFDLILMDVSMPVMDGLDATRRILSILRTQGRPAPPIVALTAHALDEHRRDCLDAGMADFLTKPVSRERLQAVLERLARVPGR